METQQTHPKIAVVAVIFKEGKTLLGKRVGNAAGQGEFSSPGGHLEMGESFVECAKREVFEETAMEVDNLQFICIANDKRYLPKHWIAIVFRAEWKSGEPQRCEPDRCEGWGWYDLDKLPAQITYGTESGLRSIMTDGRLFFDM